MFKIYNIKERKFIKSKGWTNLTRYFKSVNKAQEFIKKICQNDEKNLYDYKIMKAR